MTTTMTTYAGGCGRAPGGHRHADQSEGASFHRSSSPHTPLRQNSILMTMHCIALHCILWVGLARHCNI
eukprot:4975000-Pyramimonas_sp.AAC.1